jgi:hypothetical protein
MKRMYLIASLIIVTTSIPIYCQSVDGKRITWSSEQCLEKHSNMTLNIPSKIISRGRTSIDIIIQDQTMSLSIQQVTGEWLNENTDGQLEYSVLYNNTETGIVKISRSKGITKISVDFTATKTDGMNQEFTITNSQVN